MKCRVSSSNRRYINNLNKNYGVVALGRYRFDGGGGFFRDLMGNLNNCVWKTGPNLAVPFGVNWIDDLDLTKARNMIRSSPMFEGNRIEYTEPKRDFAREGFDSLRNLP